MNTRPTKLRPVQVEFDALMKLCFTPEDLATMPAREQMERRAAFFAGARSVYKVLTGDIDTTGTKATTEEARAILLAAIGDELEEFIAEYIASIETEGSA
jgi:hypothetical protein